jgi:hypothetical protein
MRHDEILSGLHTVIPSDLYIDNRLPLTMELFHQLAFFRSKLQAHILLPLQAYRCLYPLEL